MGVHGCEVIPNPCHEAPTVTSPVATEGTVEKPRERPQTSSAQPLCLGYLLRKYLM